MQDNPSIGQQTLQQKDLVRVPFIGLNVPSQIIFLSSIVILITLILLAIPWGLYMLKNREKILISSKEKSSRMSKLKKDSKLGLLGKTFIQLLARFRHTSLDTRETRKVDKSIEP